MIRHRRASTLRRLVDVIRWRLSGEAGAPYAPSAYAPYPPARQTSWIPHTVQSASSSQGGTPPGFGGPPQPPPFPGAPGANDGRWTTPGIGAGTFGASGPYGGVGGPSPNTHRLYRNPQQGKVAGVCAGIADYFGVDVALVRVAAVICLLVGVPFVVTAYVVLAIVLKPAPRTPHASVEEEAFWRDVSTHPDRTLSALHVRLQGLDRQIAGMESFIASREFDLRRQFKDLEK